MLVNEASVTGVFRTILILLALFFAVRILGRLLRPMINPGNKKTPGSPPQADSRREGEVRIEYPKKEPNQGKEKGKPGDYIDFEEVD